MSVWSSENDGNERIHQVVSEAKASDYERVQVLEAKWAEVARLLRDAARYGGLNPDDCTELAGMMDKELGERRRAA